MRISEERDETVYDSTSRTEHSINKESLKTLTSSIDDLVFISSISHAYTVFEISCKRA